MAVTQRIKPQRYGTMNEEDRLTLARLLVKAGYSVQIVREQVPGKKTTVISVEFRGEE